MGIVAGWMVWGQVVRVAGVAWGMEERCLASKATPHRHPLQQQLSPHGQMGMYRRGEALEWEGPSVGMRVGM